PGIDGRYVFAVEKKFSKTSHSRSKPVERQGFSSTERAEYEAYCPHFPSCVGCPFIKVPYPEQLLKKRAIVGRALAEYSSLAGADVSPVVPSPQRLGYRARVKLVVRKNRDQVAMGLYVPQTHRVIDISSCPVHPRQVNQVVFYLKKKVLELGIAPYDERDDSGDLRYVDFRFSVARHELSLTLVTRHASFPQGAPLAKALQQRFPFITGVIQNVNENRGNVIWGNSFRTLGGRDTIMERVGDLKLVFPAGVFSQANPFTARKLYDRVYELAALKGGETVLDLYCGVGPISLYLAVAARQVWAVDDSELSITTAKQNARRNGRGNCRFIAGDVATTLTQLTKDLPRIDLMVLNPPRKGIKAAALEAVLAASVPRIIYVSCEPRSLARDLDRLVAANYRVEQIQPFDMFPQTEEVETLVLLRKNDATANQSLDGYEDTASESKSR
ncbi:MAG TPA: 23S rRNA (uracil(1939)-C(5))-methyltransferase RlmD, partial [Candidatus Limnocylindrales bacterium]|nr:23S rRNA (uracil(1939)-C(5))-methyltransferase RlmD [Candidatus Limnocylindrales bacterium]